MSEKSPKDAAKDLKKKAEKIADKVEDKLEDAIDDAKDAIEELAEKAESKAAKPEPVKASGERQFEKLKQIPDLSAITRKVFFGALPGLSLIHISEPTRLL